MSAYNRYYFTKDVYPKHIVILLKKGKPYSFGIDRKILNHIGFKEKTYILQKKKINYLILDELDIVEKYDYDDNNYDRYEYLVKISEIFDEIKVTMSKKYDML